MHKSLLSSPQTVRHCDRCKDAIGLFHMSMHYRRLKNLFISAGPDLKYLLQGHCYYAFQVGCVTSPLIDRISSNNSPYHYFSAPPEQLDAVCTPVEQTTACPPEKQLSCIVNTESKFYSMPPRATLVTAPHGATTHCFPTFALFCPPWIISNRCMPASGSNHACPPRIATHTFPPTTTHCPLPLMDRCMTMSM